MRAAICAVIRRSTMSSLSVEPKEVSLSVPWGHVAGRAWGDPLRKPVLALHGWLDNAGSFDALIPLLSDELYVVAVDWPGHGKSSHIPARYCVYDYLADIKHIVDALKWEKFSLLAHSMGGGAASWFAGAAPEQVECVVLLEALGFWGQPMEELPQLTGYALKALAKFDKLDSKTYPTWESVVDRIVEGHNKMDKKFDRECARRLAQRGTRQLEDGTYQFTRDLRVKAPSIVKVSHELNEVYVKAIQCPTLVTIGDSAATAMNLRISERFPRLNDQIKVVQVSGGHYLHLQQPEALYTLVNSFLLHQTIPQGFKEISKA